MDCFPHIRDDATVYLAAGQGTDPTGALAGLRAGTNTALPAGSWGVAGEVLAEVTQTMACYGYRAHGALHDVLLGRRPADTAPHGTSMLAQFAASVALSRILARAGTVPSLIVSQSLGECAALVAAGALTVAEGTRLVCALSDVYRNPCARGALVLVQAGEAETQALLARTARDDLALACVNTPRQTVVSGSTDAVAALMGLAGPRRKVLPVPLRAHEPALWECRDRFLDLIGDVDQRPLRVPVYSSTRRRCYTAGDKLGEALADNWVMPAYSVDAFIRLAPPRGRLFIELGIGRALAHAVGEVLPGAHTLTPLVPPGASR
ncbi:acyltransferase domain-containing protein [Streptomyces sp. NPDC056061]|uniref:acyltransferase domain-containing protein n=1 Tax=Streptomyces sp. NPDC056061 TaxID=3345700 RepID=UPI0035D724C3